MIQYTVLTLLLVLPAISHGQFLNIELEIEPEVDTRVERNLDFGDIVAGDGLQEISLGAPNMGVFHIRALRTQRLLISMDADDELTHQNSSINASMPIELFASYTNDNIDDYRNSTQMGSLLETVIIEAPPDRPGASWSGMYVYVYGNIDVGNIPLGTYRGEIVLTVVYE